MSVRAGPAVDRHYVMRRKNHTRFSVLLILPILGGCLPATFTTVPEVKGRVTTMNGQPLPGAEVRIVQKSPEKREWTLKADESGNFRQKESENWTLAPLLPLDALGPEFELTAKHGEQSSEVL